MDANDIHIENGTAGVVDTGTLQRTEAALDALQRAGYGQLAESLKRLAEAIISSELLTDEKNHGLEMLGTVAGEASRPKDNRREATALGVSKALLETVKANPAAFAIWQKIEPTLTALLT